MNAEQINDLVWDIHEKNKLAGWWNDSRTGNNLLGEWYTPYVIGTKLSLIMSEVVEALEGYRKDLQDDKLPHRTMVEVELADAFIRILDLAGALGCDLGGAVEEKRNFNVTRVDHSADARKQEGGKRF